MARWLGSVGVAVAVLLLAGLWLARPAEAVEFGCQIGKPSYCFKYGQMFCLRNNELPDRDAACADWTQACLDCHGLIPQCLGGTRPPHKDPLCTACTEQWRSCMHAIDKAFWPNRRRKSADAGDGATSEPEAATSDGRDGK